MVLLLQRLLDGAAQFNDVDIFVVVL